MLNFLKDPSYLGPGGERIRIGCSPIQYYNNEEDVMFNTSYALLGDVSVLVCSSSLCNDAYSLLATTTTSTTTTTVTIRNVIGMSSTQDSSTTEAAEGSTSDIVGDSMIIVALSVLSNLI